MNDRERELMQDVKRAAYDAKVREMEAADEAAWLAPDAARYAALKAADQAEHDAAWRRNEASP
jgi:hypothetical protein